MVVEVVDAVVEEEEAAAEWNNACTLSLEGDESVVMATGGAKTTLVAFEGIEKVSSIACTSTGI